MSVVFLCIFKALKLLCQTYLHMVLVNVYGVLFHFIFQMKNIGLFF